MAVATLMSSQLETPDKVDDLNDCGRRTSAAPRFAVPGASGILCQNSESPSLEYSGMHGPDCAFTTAPELHVDILREVGMPNGQSCAVVPLLCRTLGFCVAECSIEALKCLSTFPFSPDLSSKRR